MLSGSFREKTQTLFIINYYKCGSHHTQDYISLCLCQALCVKRKEGTSEMIGIS
jgi:hypothetical protein